MTREEEINKAYDNWQDDLECSERTVWKCACRWADEHPKNPWISVEERLPKRENDKASWSNYVFIRTCFNSHEEAKYDTINHIWYDKHKKILDDNKYVTHWMPIPELLKKGE